MIKAPSIHSPGKFFYMTSKAWYKKWKEEEKKCACTTSVQAFDANHMSLTQDSMLAGIEFKN